MGPESVPVGSLWAASSPSSIYLNPNANLTQISPSSPLSSSSSSSLSMGQNLTLFDGGGGGSGAGGGDFRHMTGGHNSMAHPGGDYVQPLNWGMLGLTLIIVCTAVGNLLVCLAVCWEKRLQNMTNYFLMSLAIADFLVSLLVMPLGMVVEMFGHFPMSPEMCVLWVASDVLMCSASIWHMCTMSMDRYFTLNYPMRYGRNKTRRMVAGKILFVWVVSVSIASPICIYGFIDSSIVYNDGACVPVLKDFIILGSIFAFYIPLLIMLVTYILTIRILWRNEHRMQQIDRSDLKPRLAQLTAQCTGFAIPKLVASLRKSTKGSRSSSGSKRLASLHAAGSLSAGHGQSQSNPSIAMHATENRLAASRSCYSPFIKKCLSQQRFCTSVSYFTESHFKFGSGRMGSLKNQSSRGIPKNMFTHAHSTERLKAKGDGASLGMTYLSPPSSLAPSVMSASPLSSPSIAFTPPPYTGDESDDFRDDDEEEEEEEGDYSGADSKYFRLLKSSRTPSSRSLCTPVSLNGSDRSLHRRLQRRQLYLSQQKEVQQLRTALKQQKQQRDNIHYEQQQQQQLQHNEQEDQAKLYNSIQQQPHSRLSADDSSEGQHPLQIKCDDKISANTLPCPSSLSLVNISGSKSSHQTPGTASNKINIENMSRTDASCGDRPSFPSSLSTPAISVFYDRCAEEAHIYSSTAARQPDQHKHIGNGDITSCVSRELTRTQSHPTPPLSTQTANVNTELSRSQTADPSSLQLANASLDLSDNAGLLAERRRCKSPVRRKRFSKRSKKHRGHCAGSQKGGQNVSQTDVSLLCEQTDHCCSDQHTTRLLQVPKQMYPWHQHTDNHTCGHAGMTTARSDTYVSQAGRDGQRSERGMAGEGGKEGGLGLASLPLGYRRLNLDYKSMEWDRRYFQIQEEMDRCLSGEFTGSSSSGRSQICDLFTQHPSGCGHGHTMDPLNIRAVCDVTVPSQSAPTSPLSRKGQGKARIPALLCTTDDDDDDDGNNNDDNDDIDNDDGDVEGGMRICDAHPGDNDAKKSFRFRHRNSTDDDLEGTDASGEGEEGDDDDDDDDDNDDEDNNVDDDIARPERCGSLSKASKFNLDTRTEKPLCSSTDCLLVEEREPGIDVYTDQQTNCMGNSESCDVIKICLHPPSPKSKTCSVYMDDEDLANIPMPSSASLSSLALNQDTVISLPNTINDKHFDELQWNILLETDRAVNSSPTPKSEYVQNTSTPYNSSLSICGTNETNNMSHTNNNNSNCNNISHRSNNSTNHKDNTPSSRSNSLTPMSRPGSDFRLEQHHPYTANTSSTTINSPDNTRDTLLSPTGSSCNALGGEQVISSEGEITLEETDDTLDEDYAGGTAIKLRRPKVALARSRYQKRQQSSRREAETKEKFHAKAKKKPSFRKTFLRIHRGKALDTSGVTVGKNKHILSKKTASNERKASKVLGIIFMVFVTLWTPFFTVNVLSATCTSCIESVTGEMMALFLWMGYIASLANPIIYTMFNTAFRRTFIRILTCRIKRSCATGGVHGGATRSTNDGGGTTGYNYMSYTTMVASERRNTMTVLLRDESR